MLINITWLLVLAGLGLVIGGFLSSDQNILLILAIAAELAAIVLVLASWARRARDAAAAGYEEELTFSEPEADELEDEDLYAALEDESDEFAAPRSGARKPARRKTASSARGAKRKPAARTSGSESSTAKPKPTPRAKPKAKPKAPGSARAKPKRRPPPAAR